MQTITLQLDRPIKSVSIYQPDLTSATGTFGDIVNDVASNWPVVSPDEQEPGAEPENGDSGDSQDSHGVLEELLRQIANAVEQHHAMQRDALDEFGDLTVRLGMRIAKAVLKRSVQESSDRVRSLVQDVLSRFQPGSSISVLLNPIDVQRLEAAPLVFDGDVEWVADDSIPVGDAHVQSATQTLMASLEQHLDEFETLLLEVM